MAQIEGNIPYLIDSINIWNEVDEKAVMTLSDNKIHPKNIGEFRDEVLANCSSSDIYLDLTIVIPGLKISTLNESTFLWLVKWVEDLLFLQLKK